MKKEEVKDVLQSEKGRIEMVVKIMDNSFDSHAFILKLLEKFPSVYGQLLIKHDNVTTAHAEISNFLRNNATDLHIKEEERKSESMDIFGIVNPCAQWQKTD